MVHLTDHMEGRTCCLLAVCAHFVQRKVILAYCGHTAAHGSNMPQVFRWCLDAVAHPVSRPPLRRYPLLEDPRAVMLDALRIRFAVEFNGRFFCARAQVAWRGVWRVACGVFRAPKPPWA